MDFSNIPHHQLHIVMIPLTAEGHLLPMIDIARLFAARGVIITIVTTKLAASRLKAAIDRANESGLLIRLLQFRFPAQEVGLPEGCESIDTLNSVDMLKSYFTAVEMLQEPVEKILQEIQPRPSCIISDVNFTWTNETARKFHIPRFVFYGMCCFSLLCMHNIRTRKLHEVIASDSEPVVVPGLPHRIEITRSQLPIVFFSTSGLNDVSERMTEAALAADGVVVNSFDELETDYVKYYEEATGNKAWILGPVSLSNKDTVNKADRGNATSINESQCLNWLGSRPPKSVIYVCFGSACHLTAAQLIEIGLGLEASNQSFIWVIRKSDKSSGIEKWLSDGFEERVKERGLIIRGWAPQILILSHPATGGFLTHCGWNSTLEAICAGVPMIAWPLSAEQFLNERLIVQVLEIAVGVGAKSGSVPWDEGKIGELVRMDDVKKAVERLIDEGEEGEERRKRAKELGEKARKAMEEGGSSYTNMTLFIQHIMRSARHDQSVNAKDNGHMT